MSDSFYVSSRSRPGSKRHAWDRLPGEIQEAAMKQCLEELEIAWQELEHVRQHPDQHYESEAVASGVSPGFHDHEQESPYTYMPSMEGRGKFASAQEKWFVYHRLYGAVCSGKVHDVRQALDHAFSVGIEPKTKSLLLALCDVLVIQGQHSGLHASEVARALDRGDWIHAFDLIVDISLARGADRSLLLTALTRLCADSNSSQALQKAMRTSGLVSQARQQSRSSNRSSQPEEFYVTLKRPANQSLGLDLEVNESAIRISCVQDTGAVARYNNTTDPDFHITDGDRIVEVNGVSRDTRRMSETMESARTVKLLVKRPKEDDDIGDEYNNANVENLSNMRSHAMQFVITPAEMENVRGRLLALLHAEATEHAAKVVAKAWQELENAYKMVESQGGSRGFGPGFTPLSRHEEHFFRWNQINNAVHQESLPELRRAIAQAVNCGMPSISLEIEIAYRDALMRRHQSSEGFSQSHVLSALEAGDWWDALDDLYCVCFSKGADKKMLIDAIAKVCTHTEAPSSRDAKPKQSGLRHSYKNSRKVRADDNQKRGLLTKENVESMSMATI